MRLHWFLKSEGNKNDKIQLISGSPGRSTNYSKFSRKSLLKKGSTSSLSELWGMGGDLYVGSDRAFKKMHLNFGIKLLKL